MKLKRANKKKTKEEVFDYGQVIFNFDKDLKKLRDHIQEHQAFVGWEEVVAELNHFFELLDGVDNFDFDDWEHEQAHWDRTMDFLRDNMRKWWC